MLGAIALTLYTRGSHRLGWFSSPPHLAQCLCCYLRHKIHWVNFPHGTPTTGGRQRAAGRSRLERKTAACSIRQSSVYIQSFKGKDFTNQLVRIWRVQVIREVQINLQIPRNSLNIIPWVSCKGEFSKHEDEKGMESGKKN